MVTFLVLAAVYAAGVFTGLSKDKIVAWFKSQKTKL